MDASSLVYLLQDAIEKRAAERKAFAEYGGYSWGYVGEELILAASKADAAFGDALTEFINEQIAKAQ